MIVFKKTYVKIMKSKNRFLDIAFGQNISRSGQTKCICINFSKTTMAEKTRFFKCCLITLLNDKQTQKNESFRKHPVKNST